MIFVTVGSQKFPFDRLIQKVDQMIRKGLIHEVFMQTGTSRYVPGCPHQAFCEQERFDELMETCDLLITHGGAGTMVDAVKKYANVDFNEIKSTEEAKKLADEHHIEYEDRHEKGDILSLFFEEYVEEHLIQPTFVTDHPIEISPLTKKKPEDPNYVERFEFFMNGWEMANAYSELNDPIDQRARFEAQEKLLAAGDDEANHTDEDFLNALSIGMPPTGGIGFGIDRMVMMMTNSPAIRDVLLFPTMKTLGGKDQ